MTEDEVCKCHPLPPHLLRILNCVWRAAGSGAHWWASPSRWSAGAGRADVSPAAAWTRWAGTWAELRERTIETQGHILTIYERTNGQIRVYDRALISVGGVHLLTECAV